MFRGRYEHTIDQKGRLSIPAHFRELLSDHYKEEKLIVTNLDQCLWAYPVKEWNKVEDKIAALPQMKPEVKALQRFFVSAAAECPLDPNGRIVVPTTLRNYGAITKDVVLVGMTNRIEIWSKERWQKVAEQAEKDIASNMGDQLANLGL